MNKSIFYKKVDGVNHIFYEDREIVALTKRQVLVKVLTAGLNRADLLQFQGLYQVPKGETEVPGVEICGIVVETGSDSISSFKGKRICAVVPGGGFSQFCIVDENMIISVPDNWSDEEAAAFPESALTASESLFRLANLKAGQDVLITAGSSGIGSYMIKVASSLGLMVTTLSREMNKEKQLKELGACRVLITSHENYQKELHELEISQRFDAIIDFLGGDYTQKFIKMAKVDSTIVMAGLMAGQSSLINWVDMINKRITLKPLTLRMKRKEEKAEVNSYFANQLMPEIEKKGIKPVIHKVFRIEEIGDAYRYMEKSNHVGKIVIKIN